MQTYVRGKFYLENIIHTTGLGEQIVLPDLEGLIIKCKLDAEVIPIAYIYWDNLEQDCYIQTIKDNFQTYVVLYEDFGNFVCLVDEAYDIIKGAYLNKSVKTTEYKL